MTSAAVPAARAASLPCPRPSIPATSAPAAETWTMPRSPLVASPRRHLPARPHSTGVRVACSVTPAALLAAARELVAVPPLGHGHGGTGIGVRVHGEVVHEAPRSREAEPEAASPAVVVAQGRLDVADPRPFVGRDDGHAVSA